MIKREIVWYKHTRKTLKRWAAFTWKWTEEKNQKGRINWNKHINKTLFHAARTFFGVLHLFEREERWTVEGKPYVSHCTLFPKWQNCCCISCGYKLKLIIPIGESVCVCADKSGRFLGIPSICSVDYCACVSVCVCPFYRSYCFVFYHHARWTLHIWIGERERESGCIRGNNILVVFTLTLFTYLCWDFWPAISMAIVSSMAPIQFSAPLLLSVC